MELLAVALAEPLDKPFPWAAGFLFGNTELSLELWIVIAGISGLDDSLFFRYSGGTFQLRVSSSRTWRYMNAPVKHVASSQWPPTISPEGRAAATCI